MGRSRSSLTRQCRQLLPATQPIVFGALPCVPVETIELPLRVTSLRVAEPITAEEIRAIGPLVPAAGWRLLFEVVLESIGGKDRHPRWNGSRRQRAGNGLAAQR